VSKLPEHLDLTLTARLREVVAGSAATEGELRLLAEQGHGLARTLVGGIASSEARLGVLAAEPEAAVAEMAAELRRVERLREELDDLRADLAALEKRARRLRGEWMRPPR
jgi:ubiquinone biosynthesis protein UbiJ